MRETEKNAAQTKLFLNTGEHMTGRPATPVEVHKLHGTFRPSRHNNRGPTTGSEPLRKPDDLDPIACEHWDLVTRTRGPWLASSDAPALTRLCELWSLAQRSLAELKETPSARSPRYAFGTYHAEWSKLAARFGLTPSDRARLGEGADVHQRHDELEELLA